MFIKLSRIFILSNLFKDKASLALLTLVLLTAFSCGKRKPPLPPVERVPQRVEISGFQQGSVVNLAWVMPARNASDGSLLNIERIEVYRLAEPLNSTLSLTEEEFAAQSTLIATVTVSADDFARKQLNFKDTLDFAGQAVRLRYSIRFVNASGQRAAFSNFLLIEPTARIALPPGLLKARETKDAIVVSWAEPEANVDGSRPANIMGFNIYRMDAQGGEFKLLNNSPVLKTEYSDSFFDFDKEYTYVVRSVSLGANGAPIESLNSGAATILARDTFPPAPPDAITVAAAPNNLSIFFAFNTEKDVVGYRLYRSLDPALPKREWQLLTRELLTKNTFQDITAESGKTYYYYLTAVDKAGNISEPSEVVSETIP